MRFLKKISLINIFRTPKKSDFFKMPFKNGDSLYWTRFAQNDPKPPGYAAWTLGGWNGPVFRNIQKRLGYYNRAPKTVTLFFWWRHRGPWSQPRGPMAQCPPGYIEDMSPLPYPGGIWNLWTKAPDWGPGQCQKWGVPKGGHQNWKKIEKKKNFFSKKSAVLPKRLF